MCGKEKAKVRIRYKPSLFQHVGQHSSLKGKIQKLKVTACVSTFEPRRNLLQFFAFVGQRFQEESSSASVYESARSCVDNIGCISISHTRPGVSQS